MFPQIHSVAIVPLVFGGLITLLNSLGVAVSVGAVPVSITTVLGVIIYKLSPDLIERTWTIGREAIIWNIRFP